MTKKMKPSNKTSTDWHLCAMGNSNTISIGHVAVDNVDFSCTTQFVWFSSWVLVVDEIRRASYKTQSTYAKAVMDVARSRVDELGESIEVLADYVPKRQLSFIKLTSMDTVFEVAAILKRFGDITPDEYTILRDYTITVFRMKNLYYDKFACAIIAVLIADEGKCNLIGDFIQLQSEMFTPDEIKGGKDAGEWYNDVFGVDENKAVHEKIELLTDKYMKGGVVWDLACSCSPTSKLNKFKITLDCNADNEFARDILVLVILQADRKHRNSQSPVKDEARICDCTMGGVCEVCEGYAM